jgi:hypothetical protein
MGLTAAPISAARNDETALINIIRPGKARRNRHDMVLRFMVFILPFSEGCKKAGGW